INQGKAKYAWVTILPMLFVGVITITAAWINMTDIYLPMTRQPGLMVQGYVNFILTGLILVSVVIIFVDAVPKWYRAVLSQAVVPAEAVE
ncbi:MAG TPA: hypothetical protein PKV38_07635, partial [bacterium]|nr:hypothetical protein [bacterium]